MASKPSKSQTSAADLLERVEKYTEHFIDLRAEERRLVQTLARLRRVQSQVVAELAACAAEATEASVRERLRDV